MFFWVKNVPLVFLFWVHFFIYTHSIFIDTNLKEAGSIIDVLSDSNYASGIVILSIFFIYTHSIFIDTNLKEAGSEISSNKVMLRLFWYQAISILHDLLFTIWNYILLVWLYFVLFIYSQLTTLNYFLLLLMAGNR